MRHLLEVLIADEAVHEQVAFVLAPRDERRCDGRLSLRDPGLHLGRARPVRLDRQSFDATSRDRVDHAEIGQFGDRDLGDLRNRLGDRRLAAGAGGDAIEQIEATGRAVASLDHHRHVAGETRPDDNQPVADPEVDSVVVVVPDSGRPDDDHGHRSDDRRGADLAAERRRERNYGEEPDDDQVGLGVQDREAGNRDQRRDKSTPEWRVDPGRIA